MICVGFLVYFLLLSETSGLQPSISKTHQKCSPAAPKILAGRRFSIPGLDDSQIANRIYAGWPVDISSVPYQVSLRLRGRHICGAAIILPKFILTAAHCTDRKKAIDLSVRAGSNFVDQGGEVIDVVAKQEHEQYNVASRTDCDISILMLSRKLIFGNNVALIPVVMDNVELLSGAVGIATGWGKNWLSSSLKPKLRQALFVSLDPSYCVYSDRKVTTNMLCMGGIIGESTCCGDSGGPLAVDGTLVGLISFGSTICESPAVFTKVAKFIPWLRWNIKSMNKLIQLKSD